MDLHFTGIIIAVACFLVIGLFHPIVVKTEYYTGTRYWWMFLVGGIACIAGALFVAARLRMFFAADFYSFLKRTAGKLKSAHEKKSDTYSTTWT